MDFGTRTKNLQKGIKRPRSENPLDFCYKDNRLNSNDIIPPWEEFETNIHLINNGEQLPTTSYDCNNCGHQTCNGC